MDPGRHWLTVYADGHWPARAIVSREQVAAVLAAREDMARIRIEGHTDHRRSAAFNPKLSDDRAASMRQHLVDRGASSERLVSVGHGENRPVDPSDNEEAREKNRRVEFIIEAWREVKVLLDIERRAAEVEVKTTAMRDPRWRGRPKWKSETCSIWRMAESISPATPQEMAEQRVNRATRAEWSAPRIAGQSR